MSNSESITEIGLSEIVDFLKDVDNYPGHPTSVKTIETHMSWVFLTDRYVYKLKKPIKLNSLDFRSPVSRKRSCEDEIRLNRRLARNVYLRTVPLTIDSTGKIEIEGSGSTVDWLVLMKRLPADKMLVQMLKDSHIDYALLRVAAEKLTRFYQKQQELHILTTHHQGKIYEEVLRTRRELVSPIYKLPHDTIEEITERLLDFIIRKASLFAERVTENRIVEGHGDLKPEHICLTDPPVIIDCIEFSRNLRILDVAEELSFLAIECEKCNVPEVGTAFFATYKEKSGDDINESLINFYKSKRSALRAKFAIWHLREKQYRDNPKWSETANEYLDMAKRYAKKLHQ